jgi:putative transposase
MRKQTTKEPASSRRAWETLESWVRRQIERGLPWALEEEVTEHLGGPKSARRAPVDARPGYRNGYGKPRRLALTCGTVTMPRPRVRGLEARFVSRVLPLLKRRTEEVGRLLPELYLHGLAEGDVDLALRGLLGDGAPPSASSVARLKARWQAEDEAWRRRSLADLEPVYLWIDGLYVKAGLEDETAAVLVVIAGLRDGRKVVLAVESGARESTVTWSTILRDLKQRGLGSPRLVVGDGHLGIWGALANVFPAAREQRCWNHRILNVLDKLPKKAHAQVKLLLTAIPYAETREEAERLKVAFGRWCEQRGYRDAARLLDVDWERMVTFYGLVMC